MTSDDHSRTGRKVTLTEFRQMLADMSAAEVRSLPLESLPDEIPLDVVEAAPPDLRRALEDLSFALSSRDLSRRGDDADQFGAEAAAALELADQSWSDAEARRLEEGVRGLASEWRARTTSTSGDFRQRMQTLVPRLEALRQHNARLMQSSARLDEAMEAHGAEARLQAARDRLHQRSNRQEAALASYYALNLQVVRSEMRAKRAEIEANAFDDEQLRERLDTLHAQLERSQSLLRRKLRPRTAEQERDLVQSRITELMRERDAREWVIAEHDMTRWLDGVVDASLYLRGARQEQVLRDGRLQLFQLLNMFCRQQEDAAHQVARNPFLQLDPQQAIEFLLISERFILGYFSKKRNDVTRWLGGAAERKLQDLDDVQHDILEEYRRQRKRQ